MSDRPVATLTLGGVRRAYTEVELRALVPASERKRPGRPSQRRDVIADAVRDVTTRALTAAGGDVALAALALGVSTRTVYYNCQRYGIHHTSFRPEPPCAA